MVQLEDIFPTVIDMTSLLSPRHPKMGPYLKTDSNNIDYLPDRSLLELCGENKPENRRGVAYSESYNAIWSVNPMDWARTTRTLVTQVSFQIYIGFTEKYLAFKYYFF